MVGKSMRRVGESVGRLCEWWEREWAKFVSGERECGGFVKR